MFIPVNIITGRICRALIIFLLTAIPFGFSYAQSCSWFPADCPSDRRLPDSAERLANPVTPSEISMEIRLHDFFTALMQKEAEKKNWQVYQFDESAGSGYLNADRTGSLADDLRPPHDYELSFIFIIDSDSLHAWQHWQQDFLANMQEEIKKMTSNNDYSKFTGMQDLKKNKDKSFRNACMIRVKIEINSAEAIASSVTEDFHRTGQLNMPNAVIAAQYHNDRTDEKAIFDLNQFKRCTDLAFILFGNWTPNPDGYGYYHPSFGTDKKNTDLITKKKIQSDVVRVIAMHVEGSPRHINSFLQSLDTDQLKKLIVE
ncbi:MAG TPA: hypothetical protein VFE04_09435 [Puia sp.]|nr:hypothetical protein [Puia sp.]